MDKIKKSYLESNSFYQETILGGLSCIISKKIEYIFHKRIELVIFTFVSVIVDNVTENAIKAFSNECHKKAVNEYDGRGLSNNSGVISISILIANKIDDSAIQYCKENSKPHWATKQIHIVYDITKDKFYFSKRWRIWGALFYTNYQNIIKKTISELRVAFSRDHI